MSRRPRLMRDQRLITVTTAGVQLLGPNPRRVALVVSAPPRQTSVDRFTAALASADLSTVGSKLAYTVPAGRTAKLTNAGFVSTNSSGFCYLRYIPAGGVSQIIWLNGATGPTPTGLQLFAGDAVDWFCYQTAGGSTGDMYLSGELSATNPECVTLDFAGRKSVNDGINLYTGGQPLVLLQGHAGQAITEPVYAVASAGNVSIGVLDIYEDCECMDEVTGKKGGY